MSRWSHSSYSLGIIFVTFLVAYFPLQVCSFPSSGRIDFPRQSSFAVPWAQRRNVHHQLAADTNDDWEGFSCGVVSDVGMTIQIGDVNAGRKAWKKRRRSDSPILVPCSIVGMSRVSLLQSNLVSLLSSSPYPRNSLTISKCSSLYERIYHSTLLSHAEALGFGTVEECLQQVLSSSSDLEFAQDEDGTNKKIQFTKRRRRRRSTSSSNTPGDTVLLSMTPDDDDVENMKHTGTIRIIPPNKNRTSKQQQQMYDLSAAIRLGQDDLDSEKIQSGDILTAYTFAYDATGDFGNPLLTFTLESATNQKKNQSPTIPFSSLQVGQGPFTGQVVRVSSKAGASFVDLNVSKLKPSQSKNQQSQSQGQPVLGMLRFFDDSSSNNKGSQTTQNNKGQKQKRNNQKKSKKEATIDDLFVFDDDDDYFDGKETIEDVTDMFVVEEDGSLFMLDQQTGEKTLLDTITDEDEEDEQEEEEEEEEDELAGLSPQERLGAISEMLGREEEVSTSKKKRPNQYKEGEEVQVYIQSVFPQSGRFMVCLDPSLCQAAQVQKQKKTIDKRKSKLNMQDISSCIGMECTGEIQAKSKTGTWYYVLPTSDGIHLPIGIANPIHDDHHSSFSKGDTVHVRIDGIDETRGQLTMTLLAAE